MVDTEPVQKPRWFFRADQWWWVYLALGLSALPAFFVISCVPLPELPFEGNALTYVIEYARGSLLMWIAAPALVGSALRAAAHGNSDRSFIDQIGKLLGLAAAGIACWSAALTLPALEDSSTRAWILGGGMALIGALSIALLIVRYGKRVWGYFLHRI